MSLSWSTTYTFQSESLLCKSGIIKKKIDYNSIRKVDSGNQFFVAWKLALAMKGIVIHYNKFDEIYISPQEKIKFLELLKEKNPEITIDKKLYD